MHGKWKEEQAQRMKQQHALYEKIDEAQQLRLELLDANMQVRCAIPVFFGIDMFLSSVRVLVVEILVIFPFKPWCLTTEQRPIHLKCTGLEDVELHGAWSLRASVAITVQAVIPLLHLSCTSTDGEP
jgi:hypothetical protein